MLVKYLSNRRVFLEPPSPTINPKIALESLLAQGVWESLNYGDLQSSTDDSCHIHNPKSSSRMLEFCVEQEQMT